MKGTSASDATSTAPGDPERHGRAPHRAAEQPQVALVEAADEAELLLRDLLAGASSARTGTTVSATAERDQQRDEHGRRERREHLALDALQREQRHQDDGDDEHREGDRPRHLDERLGHDRGACALRRSRLREVAPDVLDHHDGGVHHHADGEGQPAQAHQVRGEARRAHDDEAHEEGERQREDDDQRGAQLGEEEEEHQDDEDAALEQRVDHGLDAGLDERGAVVEDVEPHALRAACPGSCRSPP